MLVEPEPPSVVLPPIELAHELEVTDRVLLHRLPVLAVVVLPVEGHQRAEHPAHRAPDQQE
eukprot:5471549-Pyramimonas_sp.AAC.1